MLRAGIRIFFKSEVPYEHSNCALVLHFGPELAHQSHCKKLQVTDAYMMRHCRKCSEATCCDIAGMCTSVKNDMQHAVRSGSVAHVLEEPVDRGDLHKMKKHPKKTESKQNFTPTQKQAE